MRTYIASEHLKQRHTFTRKLVWIAPIVTLLLATMSPVWYQQNSYNWWYVMLYPGFLTLLCVQINQRDDAKLSYRAVYALPVRLEKIWYAKVILGVTYVAWANIILMLCNLLGGLLIWQIYGIRMTISPAQAFAGTACIILASVWNIPICLWLAKRCGTVVALILNIGLSIVLGVSGANSNLWIICPYSWVSRLMVPTMKILPNGIPAVSGDLPTPWWSVVLAILSSLVLLSLLSKVTAVFLRKGEVY